MYSFLLFVASFMLATNIYSQSDNPIPFRYEKLISSSCKEFMNGGCMLYKYEAYYFSEDSVCISSYNIASCMPKNQENKYRTTTVKGVYAYYFDKYYFHIKNSTQDSFPLSIRTEKQLPIPLDSSYINNLYLTTKIHHSCAKTTDGGCDIQTTQHYQLLSDSIQLWHITVFYCSSTKNGTTTTTIKNLVTTYSYNFINAITIQIEDTNKTLIVLQ